jgi:hypothetical protein
MLDAQQFREASQIMWSLLKVLPLDEAKSLIREYFSKIYQLETRSNDDESTLVLTIMAVHQDFVDRGICDISKEDHRCLLIELSDGKVSAGKLSGGGYCVDKFKFLP